MDYCECGAWVELKSRHCKTFILDPSYGWLVCWIELLEEKGYTQVNRFGVPIKYCPMCGKLLNIED